METGMDFGAKPKLKSRGRPFAKGNPGRPRGSRNKRLLALEQMLEGKAEAVVEVVVEKALAGDRMAMRLVFERVMGAKRDRALPDLDLPPIHSAADCARASTVIVAAISAGQISPSEGVAMMQVIDTALRAFEAGELDARVTALEEASGNPDTKAGGR